MESPPTLASLKERYSDWPHPIIVFNKSHSGSRLLARLLETSGVFMGAHQNDSRDSLDILELVTALVVRYYPDYTKRWTELMSDLHMGELAESVFTKHLVGFDRRAGTPWGWKFCETGYVLPVMAHLFPRAKFIHLVRDGRDVGACNHLGPDNAFWRKIYFNTDRWTLKTIWYNKWLYPLRSHVYNAIHWRNSVEVGRRYAATLGERCFEVRYEDLCLDFAGTAASTLRFIGMDNKAEAVSRLLPLVYATSVNKFRSLARWKQRSILRITSPMLRELGYLPEAVDPQGRGE